MSKNEIYNLLEIHSPTEEFQKTTNNQNAIKHLLIRVFSIIFIIGSIFILTELENFGTNDSLAILLLCAVLFLIWFVFLIIEAIVLQVRKKYILRNVNLILVGFIFVLILLFTGTIL